MVTKARTGKFSHAKIKKFCFIQRHHKRSKETNRRAGGDRPDAQPKKEGPGYKKRLGQDSTGQGLRLSKRASDFTGEETGGHLASLVIRKGPWNHNEGSLLTGRPAAFWKVLPLQGLGGGMGRTLRPCGVRVGHRGSRVIRGVAEPHIGLRWRGLSPTCRAPLAPTCVEMLPQSGLSPGVSRLPRALGLKPLSPCFCWSPSGQQPSPQEGFIARGRGLGFGATGGQLCVRTPPDRSCSTAKCV